MNLVSDHPEVATVSPSSLVLSACGTAGAQEVTVTPLSVGSATVTTTVDAATNTTKGGFNVQNARFTAKVTAVPNTPPTLDIIGVNDGGTYVRGELARPECVATDVDDFPTAPHTKIWPAPLTEISGPYAVDNIGTRYAMCSYVDGSGVQVLARKGWSIVDETAPVISRVFTPAADGSGWFRGNVSVDWTVTEAQSPSSLTTTGCEDESVTSDTKLTMLTCAATSAGGTNSSTLNIRRDATAPVVSPDDNARRRHRRQRLVHQSRRRHLHGDRRDVTVPRRRPRGGHQLADPAHERRRRAGPREPGVHRPGRQLLRRGRAEAHRQGRHHPAERAQRLAQHPEAGRVGLAHRPGHGHLRPRRRLGQRRRLLQPRRHRRRGHRGQTVSGTCTDHAGHKSATKDVTIKLDRGAPVVTETVVASGAAGNNGWYTSDVDVDFTATDALSGLDSATKRVTSSSEGAAVEVSSPAFTDRAGNTTTPAGAVTKTFKIDKTSPKAPSAALSTPAGTTGWHTAPVTVTFTDEGDQGSGIATCTSPITVEADTAEQIVSGTCTDNAGLVSAETKVVVKLDRGAPVVSEVVEASDTDGKDGWYTGDVEVKFTATDALSGLVSATQTVTSSGEGAAVVVSSPAFTDRAGNTTPAGTVKKAFKVDKTAPAVPTFVGGPSGSVYFGDALTTPTCTSSDSGSGSRPAS